MLCCLNPDCPNPLNPDDNQLCRSCNTPLIPLLRGRYRVIKVLSDEGGFGKTYLAEDVDKLNEPCVVKQFAPKIQETLALKKAVELFKEEAKQLQQLGEHHQIPTLLAYFEQNNYLFLVQQYIDGQNLLQELHKKGLYNESKIREFLLDLLPVLEFIHKRGVIHRDIKPQNIIRRDSDRRLVLIDFGASKQLSATVQTKIGTAIGSHGYTPIEQMQDGKAYPASDLFSLGATCFHLLTGIVPSKLWMQNGYSWVTHWRRYLNQQSQGGTISECLKLGNVLDKLLRIDIQQRYQSADEVLKDVLRQSSQPISSTFISVSRTSQVLASLPLDTQRKKHLLVSAGIVLLGLGGVWYSYSQPLVIPKPSNLSQPINKTLEDSDSPNTLKGHSSDVNSVAFSVDGKTLASGSDDNTIKIWNLANQQEIRTFKGHSEWIWTVAFSVDGKILASGSADKTIRLWNVETGEEIGILKGHAAGVSSIAFSPDGKTLASGSLDKTIKLWNLETSQEIYTFKGHSKAVASVAFSPDGTTLASGSWDKTIKLWNLATQKEIRTFEGHSEMVLCIAFAPDNLNLASSSKDNSIKVWNLVTGEVTQTLIGHSDKVNSIKYLLSTDNDQTTNKVILVSGSNDNTIKLWNPVTGQEIRTLKKDSGYIYSVAVSPDGKAIASGGSADNIIKIWRSPR
ncbi:serine/threonine-protein kinase [Brasilonema sp. UFV-L1]|uniref:serine/threonine-protein kinase n=1 Tax=Brasilonema sp. UFV-L1 TaxID=2234130 RepID=UPI00145D8613|nr:serine/threonine-protein kinase [Brasilonema sp. UFV-L1]NMG07289.1 serine/threonine protein kinase [Brasilonema sp. UFV-L1]